MTGPGPLAAAGISSTTPHFIWARLSYYFTGVYQRTVSPVLQLPPMALVV